ncbi:MAG TPA: sensor histidine kinase [Clostridiaceae bacterium]|nr:sensor histidine kinase [Clostridiaceae bacterium]
MPNILNFHRIRYKLTIVFLFLIVSILIIVIYTTYSSFIEIIKNESIILNNKLIELGKNNLESSIEEVDKIFRSLYINKDFQKYIATQDFSDEYSFIDTYTNVKNVMHSLINSRRDIFSIIYVDKRNYLIFITRKEAGYIKDFLKEDMPEWFNQALEELNDKNNERLLIPTHTHIPLGFKVTDYNEKVFTISRNVINTESDYSVLGTLFINLDLSNLRKIASDIKPYKDSFTYILSPDGTIVYDSSEKHTAETLSEDVLKELKLSRGHMTVNMFNNTYIAVYTTSEISDWKVINFIPIDEYSANVSLVTRIVLIICVFAVLISIIVTFLVSKHISNPIEKLSDAMNKIEIGNMNLRVDESGNDEISILSKSFNSLLAKLQNSIQKEYELSIRQKDAEMKALQAQINPHFLYNVLQSISSIAILNNIEEINIMAKSLGKMLRYSIKTNENIVTINDECEHVMNYLSIQKMRFGDKLQYYIDIPHYVKEYSILKLTLQPVVENAIIHGFNDKEGTDIIYISCWKDEDYIFFDISDNGKGIPPDKLNRIIEELNNTESGFYSDKSPSIGLKNVFVRLKIYYNNEASLSIESEEDVGTSVKIKIPARICKEEGVK